MKEVDKATEGHNDNEEHPSLLARSVDIVGDGNFPKGCEFSPDRLCLLTSTATSGFDSPTQYDRWNGSFKNPIPLADVTFGGWR